MINFDSSVRANEAISKMWNLAKALGECGIKSNLTVDHYDNIISLEANLWNCEDGSNVLFSVYAMESEDYEINSFAQPEGQAEALFADFENETEVE